MGKQRDLLTANSPDKINKKPQLHVGAFYSGKQDWFSMRVIYEIVFYFMIWLVYCEP